MNDDLLFYTAVFVFTMMIIGLGLTFWEFSRGEPKQQARAARSGRTNVGSG